MQQCVGHNWRWGRMWSRIVRLPAEREGGRGKRVKREVGVVVAHYDLLLTAEHQGLLLWFPLPKTAAACHNVEGREFCHCLWTKSWDLKACAQAY